LKYLTRDQTTENNARAKALSDALQAEDVRDVFAQPSFGPFAARPGDPNHQPEAMPAAVQALVTGAGASLNAGIQSPLTNTGAPAAPHAGSPGDMTAFAIVRQTLGAHRR
jgi:hypothetical protein